MGRQFQTRCKDQGSWLKPGRRAIKLCSLSVEYQTPVKQTVAQNLWPRVVESISEGSLILFFDWFCFYYLIGNSLVALLEALFVRIFFWRSEICADIYYFQITCFLGPDHKPHLLKIYNPTVSVVRTIRVHVFLGTSLKFSQVLQQFWYIVITGG